MWARVSVRRALSLESVDEKHELSEHRVRVEGQAPGDDVEARCQERPALRPEQREVARERAEVTAGPVAEAHPDRLGDVRRRLEEVGPELHDVQQPLRGLDVSPGAGQHDRVGRGDAVQGVQLREGRQVLPGRVARERPGGVACVGAGAERRQGRAHGGLRDERRDAVT